ncbi:hypothetical protein CH373_00745 [Leptospira perolatii]|uniref:Lipoprotein n=1 Tax=Leptospira perolatii TaxID=2023191 RepID=A0A2M9ZRB1_9LEPT|nr:hypothetical protein CH360_00745 [Leptospira perolatii]PJZ74616.1 hypothetical protein CH373_00745 [Leptospira perolatii]
MKKIYFGSLFGILFLSCVVAGSREHFVRGTGLGKAAFDLNCPQEQLQVTELGGGVGVTGCGKKASYFFSPTAGAWVLNSTGR